jgi:hypothetical protein
MDDPTNIHVTRRIALMTITGAALLGCSGSPRVVGAVVGGSALAGIIGAAFRRPHRHEQQRVNNGQNVRTATRAVRPAFG